MTSFLGDVAVFLLMMLLVVMGSVIFAYGTYGQARRKGYHPPAAAGVLLASIALGVGGTAALGPANTTDVSLFLWRFFCVPLLLSAAAAGVLLLVLPRRKLRIFGARQPKFPFRRVGQLLVALAVLLVPVVAVLAFRGQADPSAVGSSVSLTFILASVGLYLIRLARTINQPSLEETFRRDPRPPVLYLRAFNQESQFFIIGLKSEYGQYTKSMLGKLSKGDQKIGITMEEYLSDDITKALGPFVALGSPEDYLAPPGALRLYAKDDEWKQDFEGLARRAACILVEVSKSANLRWEFEHLRGENLQEKVYVLTRPSTKGSAVGWAFWGLLWRLKGIRSLTWEEFSTDLQKLGYAIGFDDPGPGSVLTFDGSGRGLLLTTGANWPMEFVDPIRAWAIDRRRVGHGKSPELNDQAR